jgi:hypothetical protein
MLWVSISQIWEDLAIVSCFMASSFIFCCCTKGKVVIVDKLRSTKLEASCCVCMCVCVCVCVCVHVCARMWVCACDTKFVIVNSQRYFLGQSLLKSVCNDVTLAGINQTPEERFQYVHLVLISRFNYTVKTVWFQDSMHKNRYVWKRRKLFYFPLK